MSLEPSIFFDEVNQRQGVFHRRTFILGGLGGLGALALTGRLLQLQVVEAQKYTNLSSSNQFNFRLRTPPRGRIMDRNGIEIASNRPDLRLLMRRDEAPDVEGTLSLLATLVPIPPAKQAQLAKELANGPRSTPVAVATDLTWEEFARVSARSPELPGVIPDVGEARVYPYGGAFAHVIGYVSRVSADDLKKVGPHPEPLLLHPGFRIGKQGVEKSLDADLRGKAGAQKVEVDSVGRVIKSDPAGDIASTPGKDVVLTLDADVQNRALEVFGTDSGAAVMMDVRTGEILCLASAPSFDANRFVTGVPVSDYKMLAEYDHKPLLDKALSGTYPPGSTFKTMVALTALENGFDPKRTYTCNGVFPFGNHVFHCDKHHGTLDLHGAIVTSCDVYFYNAALFCGPDKIAEVARRFGLGQVFDIGISGQKKGLVPDTAWKKRAFKSIPANQKWFAGETPSMGIGQGYTNINALQSCVMVSRLANGNKALLPRLIRSVGGVLQPSGADVPDLPVDKEHLAFVRRAMADVVTSGTAAATAKLGLDPIVMAGKNGTAQSHTYKGGSGQKGSVGNWATRDHAWFVAFAPADDPRYAISVIVEHGGFGGETAAPKAREIMRVALLKDPEVRARIEHAMPADAFKPGDAPVDGAAPDAPTQIGPGPALPPPTPLPETDQ
ncbi:penicillin-binding protein 2 [soil metagenome]